MYICHVLLIVCSKRDHHTHMLHIHSPTTTCHVTQPCNTLLQVLTLLNPGIDWCSHFTHHCLVDKENNTFVLEVSAVGRPSNDDLIRWRPVCLGLSEGLQLNNSR